MDELVNDQYNSTRYELKRHGVKGSNPLHNLIQVYKFPETEIIRYVFITNDSYHTINDND